MRLNREKTFASLRITSLFRLTISYADPPSHIKWTEHSQSVMIGMNKPMQQFACIIRQNIHKITALIFFSKPALIAAGAIKEQFHVF
jgi:hypothetical protein